MPEGEKTEVPFTLERVEGDVWLKHPHYGWMKLGPFKAACEELYRFLDAEDCRE